MTDRPLPGSPGRAPDLPIVLSLDGARCLVVGGGPVAARRARVLAEAGARVTVVAPSFDPALTEPTGALSGFDRELRPYRPGEAASYRLVVTATGVPEVDAVVVADARAAGVLVSNASGEEGGNVALPAVHRDGPVTVAVSTGGTSPALAVWLRARLASALGPGIPTLAGLAEEARGILRRAGLPAGTLDWDALFDEAAPLVADGRVAEARVVLLGPAEAARMAHARPDPVSPASRQVSEDGDPPAR